MEFQLQFGYGMMAHSRELLKRWQGGQVILSPRDLNEAQLLNLSADLIKLGGHVYVDPQLYLPHAVHFRLSDHAFWPSDYDSGMFWSGDELTQMLRQLLTLNQQCGTDAVILPGILANRINDDWLATLEVTFEQMRSLFPDTRAMGTLAIGADAMQDANQIAELLERAAEWSIDSFYIVCQHPSGDYLVTDPIWLANMLDLTAGLRLLRKTVVLGYCHHQMLLSACAKASAIASGTWMNVRSFPPDKFETKYEEEMKQRTTWYYCPQALSEYKLPYLDIAQRARLLSRMRPARGMDDFASILFEGGQPTTVGFTEQQAFRHFLDCLRTQVSEAEKDSFDSTLDHHSRLLDTAEELLAALREAGVSGQKRDMSNDGAIDASRAAIADLKRQRGAMLRRFWDSL